MTANDALVTFRGVQKTYDGTSLVVRDLNLDIQRGEFLSLLGPFCGRRFNACWPHSR